MLYRFVVCAGIALLAYYIGREIGRAEPIRMQLKEGHTRRAGTVPPAAEEIPAD
jgi:hypothetical protein